MRILMVEDRPGAASILAKGLREQTYAVDIAIDGEQSVFKAAVNPSHERGSILVVVLPMTPLSANSQHS
jgi:two-component system copper resistance phosphate regulon response regulator CusR